MKHTEPRSVNPSVFLLFLAALALSSCGKEENNTPTPSEDMSAMVDMGEVEDMPRTCEGAGCEEMDIPSTCGDGNLDEGEVCDDGNKDDGDYCAADCLRETGACGDGTQQDNEACDDGMNPDGACPYGEMSCMVCDANCQLTDGATSFCGDGVVQQDEGELCDDGDDNADDAECLPDCTRPFPIKLATHSLNTYALMSNGTVYGWGDNEYGQLANEAIESSPNPVLIPGLKDVIDVVSNSGAACALDQNKAVYCWGFGSAGSLGNGSFEHSYIPTKVESLSNIEKIAAGTSFVCALSEQGEVYCWGGNEREQLGFVGEKQNVPRKVELPGPAVSFGLGELHACAILDDSKAWCWGQSLGYGIPSFDSVGIPQAISELDGAEELDAGRAFTLFNRNGNLLGIGTNSQGKRTLNQCCEDTYTEAVLIPDVVTPVLYIASSWQHSCAISEGQTLSCWGEQSQGQLTEIAAWFVEITEIGKVLAVTTGKEHTCAINAERQLWCWGGNEYGQLGFDGEGGPTPREVTFWP